MTSPEYDTNPTGKPVDRQLLQDLARQLGHDPADVTSMHFYPTEVEVYLHQRDSKGRVILNHMPGKEYPEAATKLVLHRVANPVQPVKKGGR